MMDLSSPGLSPSYVPLPSGSDARRVSDSAGRIACHRRSTLHCRRLSRIASRSRAFPGSRRRRRNDIFWQRSARMSDADRREPTPFIPMARRGFTAALVLRCVEEGRLSLDDRIARFDPASPDANATVRQILTHTSGAPDALVFAYRPDRFAPLSAAVRTCTGASFRASVANLLDRFAMTDSVPGPDAVHLAPPDDGIPASAVGRYTSVLGRLATPYAVSKPGQVSPSQYAATTLTPVSGLISTVGDLARFDLALRKGALLRPDTLAAAWQPPLDRAGQPLRHGAGWLVQATTARQSSGNSGLATTRPRRFW